MNDLAVARGGAGPGNAFLFKQNNLDAVECESPSDRQADYACADDDGLDFEHPSTVSGGEKG